MDEGASCATQGAQTPNYKPRAIFSRLSKTRVHMPSVTKVVGLIFLPAGPFKT